MSHHARKAVLSLMVAVDTLIAAEVRAEDKTGGPNPDSVDIQRVTGDVKRSLYDVNSASWAAAERALETALPRVSHLAHALAKGGGKRERTAEEKVVASLLVDARKAIRSALLNLRLRKGRSE
jgi:hypothetical protein